MQLTEAPQFLRGVAGDLLCGLLHPQSLKFVLLRRALRPPLDTDRKGHLLLSDEADQHLAVELCFDEARYHYPPAIGLRCVAHSSALLAIAINSSPMASTASAWASFNA